MNINEEAYVVSERRLWTGVGVAFLLFGTLVTLAWISTPGTAGANGRMFGHRHSHDPEEIRDHAAMLTSWLLWEVEASDAQRAQVEGIVDSAAKDLIEMHGELGGRELHQEVVDQLTAETIDAQALDQLRQRKLATFETISKRALQAVVEIGRVLSVEQRRELAEMAERFHGRRHAGIWRTPHSFEAR